MERLVTRTDSRAAELAAVQDRSRKWLKGLGIGAGAIAGLGLLGYGTWKATQKYHLYVWQQEDLNNAQSTEREATEVQDKLWLAGNGPWSRATLGAIRSQYNATYPDRKNDEMLAITKRGEVIRNKISIPLVWSFSGSEPSLEVYFGTKEWLEELQKD